MANIRTQIQECNQCPLYEKMTLSPVATEYFGTPPVVLIVIGTPTNSHNDESQEPIYGAEREILKKIFAASNLKFAVTKLVKCISKTNTKKLITTCDWVKKEIDHIKPKIVIGMGQFKYTTFWCDLYTVSPSILLNNADSKRWFEDRIEELKHDKHV